MPTPFFYMKIESQAGIAVLESSGEKRMIEHGPDLAAYLGRTLGRACGLKITDLNSKEA